MRHGPTDPNRGASKLDRRVAERTRELTQTNEALQLQAGLLQNLPVSAWTLKPDGTPDFVNRVWLEVAGQTLDFVRSNPEAWMTAVHPEDRETVTKAFWAGISQGQGFAMEARTLCAQDGSYRWHLHQAVVLRDEEGKVVKFVGTSTDIDEQKRAQEKVQANELRLREMAADLDRRVEQRTRELAEANEELQLQVGLLQRLPVSAWTLKPDGTPDFVNRVWLEVTGQVLDFVRSHPEAWMTAVHPEDRETVLRAFWGGVRSGQDFAMEARTLCAHDGAYRWHLHQAVVLRDAKGNVVKFVGTSTDIDDQKRAEEKLRESEYESRLIVDSIPGLIAVLNMSGEIERVNQPILDYFGRSQEELRQWAVDDTIHPDDRPAYLQAFARSFAAGDPFGYEAVRIRRFDGVYRWLNMRGLPLRDRQGQIVRWYFLLTEVDDRKRAEDALRQAQGDLARINRVTTMGELAASLAHELSQPIAGAITNTNVCLRKLGRDKPDLDDVRAAVTRIGRDARRAAETIDRIRSQFEKGAPNQASLNVNEIIPETIALLRDEAVRHNIVVRTELAADLPPIVGDRVQLQQVTMNLIVNSIEAMKDVDGIREMVIQSQRAENDQILVSISDTGAGIPPELAEQIFDPFFTTKPHGTGMGLRISRSIIESHGGRLWAVSSSGAGAAFQLTLPALEENQIRVQPML
jgi:PAS domain S-box-containing protein